MRYAVTGKSVITGVTIDDAVLEIWNPSASKRIKVLQLYCSRGGSGDAEPVLRRSSAKGTSGSTVTPVAANEYMQAAAPPSGFTLELAAFTVQPTLIAGPMHAWCLSTPTGSALLWMFDGDGIEIPGGQGLVVTIGSAVAYPASRFHAVVED